ncbi:hypothetical protein [Parapedobacter indicus]|uniref:Lipoprotein n=1 Tax=Parapedobacter indicus TaxID=1477437 RepID=A0A1I3RUE4_9SPHI|nr:hypothetical protein [Parapedobacter indicus]PPK99975.1 hypothetical protein CLV26_110105 [Parapedobacter indicus]SFJ49988.1 hypothetical protein SAMN05444682_110140 [Parapedobacter indicus]
MKTTIRKTLGLLTIALAVVSCSKKDDPNPEGTSECWYKVTIDGETTSPNQFGQDKVVITGGVDPDSGIENFIFAIYQEKGGNSQEVALGTTVHGLFNSKSATGIYPAGSFQSGSFSTPRYELYPRYYIGNYNDDHIEHSLTFTLLENSDQRIHMKVSGTVIKEDKVGNEVVEIGPVPIETEIKIDRSHYMETIVEGAIVGGAYCECQEQ